MAKLALGEVWCPECNGTGRVGIKDHLGEKEERCSECEGTGKLDEGVDEDED